MPAKDQYHDVVKHALIKAGWTITHDPLFLRSGGVAFHIDLGAERVLGAEKAGQKIAVEIKGFQGSSLINEFHEAAGQFGNYHIVLAENDPERMLYLAVPIDVYDTFFQLPFGQAAIRYHHLKLLVYRVASEEITLWLP